MGTDCRAIKKNHAQAPIPIFDLVKEALSHTELRPANKQLCRNPPGTKLGWHGTPFRAVLASPEQRGYRPSKVLRWSFSLRTDFLDQRFPYRPGLIRKNRLYHAHHKQLCSPFCHSRPKQALAGAPYVSDSEALYRLTNQHENFWATAESCPYASWSSNLLIWDTRWDKIKPNQ